MPKRSRSYKRKPTTAKRVKYTRRKRALKKNVVPRSIVRTGVGFPKKMLVTHKYKEVLPLNTAAGVMGSYTFSCNGMYDPNITGTGHQPMYFDQLTALYNHYVVIGSKIRIRILNATSYITKVGFFINDDTSVTSTNVEAVGEQTQGKMYMLPGNGPSKPLTITAKWSAKKMFGKGVLANSTLQGTASSNPSEQSYYVLTIQSADGIATSSVFVDYEIEYIAMWVELKDVNQS